MHPNNGDVTKSPRTPSSNNLHISSPDRLSRINNTVDHRKSSSFQAMEDFSSSMMPDNADMLSDDIQKLTISLSNEDDKSDPPEIPDSVEEFTKLIESTILVRAGNNKSGTNHRMTHEDTFLVESVVRLNKLVSAYGEFSSSPEMSASLDRMNRVLQRAMNFLEEELRSLLEDDSKPSPMRSTHSSSKKKRDKDSTEFSPDQVFDPDQDENSCNYVPGGYSPEMVTRMRRIVSAMITCGYERECLQVYSIARRSVFMDQLKNLENEKLNMDDVYKMSWDSLEKEINRWLKIVKTCSTAFFPAEKTLGERVFADQPLTFATIFGNLARSVVIRFLDFAGAVAATKRSAEKLFKFLDMYETLHDIIPAITIEEESKSDVAAEHELRSEIAAACGRLGEAATNIFLDMENSIKNDAAKSAVPGGAVHPLTRYVLNYLKYACEYKTSLEKIFERFPRSVDHGVDQNPRSDSEDPEPRNPFSLQILKVMDLLDCNIETKSMLYKDPSLRCIFLMNNGRYVLQKVKSSPEIHQLMGDTWCRKRSTVVRQYHKNYQRETWVRLLHCLTQEGLLTNGKVNKALLKERFKSFNVMFEEIHKSQSSWVVSDEQLQSELRVSISAVVIPAYRSFVGRFKQHLDSKQSAKYIKYLPEDLETEIEDLFAGVSHSMARRR